MFTLAGFSMLASLMGLFLRTTQDVPSRNFVFFLTFISLWAQGAVATLNAIASTNIDY